MTAESIAHLHKRWGDHSPDADRADLKGSTAMIPQCIPAVYLILLVVVGSKAQNSAIGLVSEPRTSVLNGPEVLSALRANCLLRRRGCDSLVCVLLGMEDSRIQRRRSMLKYSRAEPNKRELQSPNEPPQIPAERTTGPSPSSTCL